LEEQKGKGGFEEGGKDGNVPRRHENKKEKKNKPKKSTQEETHLWSVFAYGPSKSLLWGK